MNPSENQTAIFPKGEKGPAEYFTGTVWIKVLVPHSNTFNCQIAHVQFEPKARTNWHTHPGGQILIVTNGKGYYQEKDKPVQIISNGDVVTISPDVLHWHGAIPDSEFSHIAVNTNSQKGIAVWLDKVTDEEYSSLKSG